MTRARRIVIAGGGRAGLETAVQLDDRGHEVTIIEQDPERCAEIADEYVAVVIEGDATRPTILEQAGVGDADAVGALTDDAATNLAVCTAAHRLSPGVQTLARTQTADEQDYGEMVDAVILPQHEAANKAVDLLSGRPVRTLVAGQALDILEIEVADDAPVAGHSLDEVSLPEGALVVSDAARTELASADTVLQPGERYLLAVEAAVADEVQLLFRG